MTLTGGGDPRRRRLFDERLKIDGTRIDANIEGRVTAATLVRTMDGASSLELECADHDLKLLRSGLLTRDRKKQPKKVLEQAAWQRFGQMRLTLDGARFRLAGVQGVYNAETRQATLVFEDEIASLMRRHKTKLKARRQDPNDDFNTRADFIWRLAKAVQETPIVVYSPESNDEQKIRGSSERAKDKAREKGIASGKKLTIKGVRADRDQIRQIETALAQADKDRAGDRATIALLVAGIGESAFRAVMNSAGSGYGGVFQGDIEANYRYFKVNQTAEMAHYFLVGGKGFQQGGAKKLAAENPEMESGDIATRVEASGEAPEFYSQWEDEAAAILDAWGGPGRIKIVDKPFEYRVQKGENYWDAAGRLARDVRWRLWADQNQLWYVSDEWLIRNRPTFILDPTEAAAVRGFSFDADVGIPVSEVTVEAQVARWVGPPGSVVELDDLGPLTGRWLLWESRLNLFTEDSTLTLRRPEPKLPEPAADRDKVIQTESEPEAGSVRAEIVRVAKRALRERENYTYAMERPYPNSLFGAGGRGPTAVAGESIFKRVDCSSFVTLVYKAAGADDPNNRGYDGNGYTGTLWANGVKTNDPQPGDLAFYGDPPSPGGSAHVNVYIGGGESINMGPSAGVSRGNTKTGFRNDFAGFRSYV